MRLLLLSSSTASGFAYFEYPKPYIKNFLGQEVIKIAFVREGMMFRIEDNQIRHEGVFDKTCRIFKYDQNPVELGSDDDF